LYVLYNHENVFIISVHEIKDKAVFLNKVKIEHIHVGYLRPNMKRSSTYTFITEIFRL